MTKAPPANPPAAPMTASLVRLRSCPGAHWPAKPPTRRPTIVQKSKFMDFSLAASGPKEDQGEERGRFPDVTAEGSEGNCDRSGDAGELSLAVNHIRLIHLSCQ